MSATNDASETEQNVHASKCPDGIITSTLDLDDTVTLTCTPKTHALRASLRISLQLSEGISKGKVQYGKPQQPML
jgi:hypothetical protein